ncbi:MAG: hypothetical protein WCC84_02600 [Candidatus Cybelea sp.]
MQGWNLSHYAISSCVTAALLAGCGGSQPPIGAPGFVPARRARTVPRYLYVTNGSSDNISAFAINASSGALTQVHSPFKAGRNPFDVVAR